MSEVLNLTSSLDESLKDSNETMATGKKTWTCETIEYAGFKDLGNYIIEMPDYTDASVREKGLAIQNARYDHGDISQIGCTAMILVNSKGEIVVGRNMDVEISQYPAYVFKTTYGKYVNYCVTYAPGAYKTYEEVKKQGVLNENWMNSLIYNATDCMNEKGLYIEANMRTSYARLSNYGLHSARGEERRDDGTPWKELRACTMAVPQLVSQNCATVKEALDFLKNSYDWYTLGLPSNPHYDGWNMCFIIGDALGEYGLVEIAQDEISYIPYQFGQANFYITPRWRRLDVCGSGEGRLQMVSRLIDRVETLDEAMDAMKAVMWRNETLWLGEAERMEDAAHPNPYNQLVFRDDQGNCQLDWRSDYVQEWPVLDDGRQIAEAKLYEEASKSSYDPKIKEYFDDAIARGTLVIDDGSIQFEVNGEKLTLTQLREKYDMFPEFSSDPDKQAELKPYRKEYQRLLDNQNSLWVHDDHNFEALKAMAYASLHIRYDENGVFDSSSMSKYEKLLAFYGYGVEKDETPLRNDASIWTTSLNIGANCAQKEMKIRFWENDEVIYHVKF